MTFEGQLDVVQLPEILQMISAQQKTGILTIQGENDIIAISFLDGEMVAADSLNQNVEEGLGEVLVELGLVTPERLAAVSAEQQLGGKRLIDLLLEKGFVGRRQILEALRSQTFSLLSRILLWRQGEFKFYAGDEVAFEEGFVPISVEELLLRAFEETPEEVGLEGEPPAPDTLFERASDLDLESVLTAGEGEEDATLGPVERAVLENLEGGRDAEFLARHTDQKLEKVIYALHRLHSAGFVRPLEVSVEAEAPDEPVVEQEPIYLEFPDPEEEIEEPRDPAAGFEQWPVWSGRLLAVAALIVLLVVLLRTPGKVLLPFPGQSGQRDQAELSQRQARFQKLDRGLRVFFLLEGRFPTALGEAVELAILSPVDLQDPDGRSLSYVADEISYVVQIADSGTAAGQQGFQEAVTGDFLLDAEFLNKPQVSEIPPLVLLD